MIFKKDTTKVPFVAEIAAEVERLFGAGVKLKVIFDFIQKYEDAPRSYNTFVQVYKQQIASVRADIQAEMGQAIINAARDGDWKAAESFLKHRAGWNTVLEIEEGDKEKNEETGAIDDLIALLNIPGTNQEQEER
jgi:hypothetical protein